MGGAIRFVANTTATSKGTKHEAGRGRQNKLCNYSECCYISLSRERLTLMKGVEDEWKLLFRTGTQ